MGFQVVLTGTIKKYNNERGFGFISTSNFGDVFFHIKDFQKGEQPIPGREVYFEVVKKENKKKIYLIFICMKDNFVGLQPKNRN